MTRDLSILIPSFNEGKSIHELFSRIDNVAKLYLLNVQLILVDDGSTDDTEKIASSYKSRNIKSITYIKFRKNLGKSEALSEGIIHANFDLILTLDADLQDRPEEIIKLLTKLDEGYDLVSGRKSNRLDPLFSKKIPSYIFNLIIRKVLGTNFKDINSGFKLYKKEIWDEIDLYSDFHRFIPILAFNKGYKITEVEVKHSRRIFGKSKYGIERFSKGIFDLITVYFLISYQNRPFHFFGKLGFLLIFIGTLFLSYLGYLWSVGVSIGTRPLFSIAIFLLIIGLQIILFGLLSQLLISLSREKRKRSISIVKKL